MVLAIVASIGAIGSAQRRALRAPSRREVIAGVPRQGQGEDVLVLVPEGTHAPGSLAVIVALHGRGEAVRGPQRGARGWLDDYALEPAFAAMARGRVESSDAAGMASEAQLRAMTRALRAHPFRDVAVVMPYTPDLIDEAPGSEAIAAYGQWLVEVMLPTVRRSLPALGADPARTAIDGVSLGGMLAIDVGLRHPEAFASVGGIQPAVRGRLAAYGPLATSATRCLRLASSERDPFLRATRGLSTAWRARGIAHELVEYAGPHGYSFNRGPGSLELLRFHHACFARQGR
jgi:enterochelin esterase-like enzyme